jgi:hypothetical protein
MKNQKIIWVLYVTLAVCTFAIPAHALPLLPFPTANDLIGPVFIQPFAGLQVVSEAGGVGQTEPFFADIPSGSLPGNAVVNILGNFQALDPSGNPRAFNVVDVSVTSVGSTFTPAFGEFDFAGNSSLTFRDSIDLDQVTFSAGSSTLAFANPVASPFSYTLFTTNLPVGSFLIYDDVDTGFIPEPSTFLLLGSGLAGLGAMRWRRLRRCSH